MRYQRFQKFARTTPEITQKWRELARTRSKSLRDELILFFVPYAQFCASRVIERIPAYVCADDAASAAMIGLIKAVDAFDVNRGSRFESYASTRIRGAIIDDIRESDWVPRLARERSTKLDDLRQQLRGNLKREPCRDELEAASGETPIEFARVMSDAELASRLMLSTHDAAGEGSAAIRYADAIEQTTERPPDEPVDTVDAIEAFLAHLPARERNAIVEVSLNGRTQIDVAKSIDRTEGLISQRRAAAFKIMRESETFQEIVGAAA